MRLNQSKLRFLNQAVLIGSPFFPDECIAVVISFSRIGEMQASEETRVALETALRDDEHETPGEGTPIRASPSSPVGGADL